MTINDAITPLISYKFDAAHSFSLLHTNNCHQRSSSNKEEVLLLLRCGC